MNSTNKYSIYRNGRARIGLHLLFWCLYYLFILWYNWFFSFRQSTFWGEANILLSLINLSVALIIYYYTFQIIYPLVKNKQWIWVALSAIILFFIALLFPNISLKHLRAVFPDNKFIQHFFYSDKIFSRPNFGMLFYVTIWYALLAVAIKITKDFYEEYKEKAILMDERNKAELGFLRAQIKPHFLFNALNSVYGLSIDNDKASGMVLRLSNLLRYTLYNKNTNEITLREEVTFLTDYIELEKLRHKEDKAVIEYDFTKIDNDAIHIKPLILSGILQYAFTHSGAAFFIAVTLSERSLVLSLNIDNNSASIQDEDDTDWQNIERILTMEYPEKYLLKKKDKNIRFVLNLLKDEQ